MTGGGPGRPPTEVLLQLPATWRALPLDEQDLPDPGDGPEADQIAAARELVRVAGSEGVHLAAFGPLDLGPARVPARGVVTVAVRDGGPEVPLDTAAELLGTSRVGMRVLRLGGPCGYLGWSRPLDHDTGLRAEIFQHWVPFPEDGRTAVLTVAALTAGPLPDGALEAFADRMAFADRDGTIVLPRT